MEQPPPAPRIAWSKAQQTFVAVSPTDSSCPTAKASVAASKAESHRKRIDLEAEVEAFGSIGQISDEDDDIEQFIAAREELLDRIFEEVDESDGSSSPLLLLPMFLTHWRCGLEQRALETEVIAEVVMRVCREFHSLAQTAIQMGKVALARAALGHCIQLTRRHRDAFESHTIERDAKRLLLECVQFQHELALCQRGLSRHEAPPAIVHAVVERLATLAVRAPFAVDVVALRANALLASHRSKDVVALLSTFAFTRTSASLSLALATALEYEGYYKESIATVARFQSAPQNHLLHDQDDGIVKALALHAAQLTALLGYKTVGEDALARSQYDQAERSFAEALWVARPQSRRLRAALLLGKANALIGLDRQLTARSDLEESVRLDPRNAVARMRLRTVELSQATQLMQRRMKER